jgi:hypothetical protein
MLQNFLAVLVNRLAWSNKLISNNAPTVKEKGSRQTHDTLPDLPQLF